MKISFISLISEERVFREKEQGKPPKTKLRVLLFAEPTQSFEENGKAYKKASMSSQGTRQENHKKAKIGVSESCPN